MTKKITFLAVILAVFSANAFAQKQTAEAFVDSFYKFHRARSGAFNGAEVAAHKRWLTAGLYALFQNELKREKEFLKKNPTDKPHFGDGFPFLPFEECSIGGKAVLNDLKIGAAVANADKTLVEIAFSQPKECGGELIHTYRIELVKNKNAWLINDWIDDDGERVSDDLKRAEY